MSAVVELESARAGGARKVVLGVEKLAAGYGKKEVVRGASLALHDGEIVVVLGHNGAGKTTLMKAIFGLIRPNSGKVTYYGEDVTGRAPATNVRNGLAFVPQGHSVFRTLSVRDNLELGGFVEEDKSKLEGRLEQIYTLFPILKERSRQIAGTLSGGQQQMVAIGIALMHGPRVLVLDEPSIGLAPNLVERVMASVKEINEKLGVSIIMVEQNVRLSLPIAHRAVVVKTGDVIYDGDPAPLNDHETLIKMF